MKGVKRYGKSGCESMFYFHPFDYDGETPCIGKGSEDRVGPQWVQDSARLGVGGP